MKRRNIWYVSLLVLFLFVATMYRISHASAPHGDTLKNPIHAVKWSGTVAGAAAPSSAIAECVTTACERFDLSIDLPGGVWTNKPGGVEVSIRWPIAAFGDNLFLYVYKDGTRIAKSDGVIASAQSVIVPQAVNGLYNVYVAYDQLAPNNPQDFGSASPSITYEGLAEVEYQPKPHPERQLLPDLVSRPQRNVTFQNPNNDFFEPPPPPGENCFPSEQAEEGAHLCLRFDQIFANIGEGIMEMRFVIPHDTSSPDHNIFQRIYRSEGGFEERIAGQWEFHPAHQHYHYTGFGLSKLWASNADGDRLGATPLRERRFHLNGKAHRPEPAPSADPIRTGRKVSFCLADTELDGWLKKGTGPRTYLAPDCLFPAYSDAVNDYLIQGITPGWADVYDWYLPDQFIEVSGVPDGYYILETIADPDNTLLEADETNNCGGVVIRLSNMATSSRSVELIGNGPPCQ
jgi:lysyl oxidase